MSDERPYCRKCKFWLGIHMTEDGECVRFPPQAGSSHPQREVPFQNARDAWAWPVTASMFWCGEFAARAAEEEKP
jgi:hypothetical protein